MIVQMDVSEPLETRTELEGDACEALSRLWFSRKPVLMELSRELDLFPPQIMVVQTLDQPKPMGEVADFLGCNSSNLTGITDRLEDRGLVQRTLDPDDRRVRLLVLTDEGREARLKVVAALRKPLDTIGRLDDDELATLTRLLDKLDPDLPSD